LLNICDQLCRSPVWFSRAGNSYRMIKALAKKYLTRLVLLSLALLHRSLRSMYECSTKLM
jgi:hypothetical protein